MLTKENIEKLAIRLSAMFVFRDITEMPAVVAYMRLLRELCIGKPDAGICVSRYSDIFHSLRESGFTSLDEYIYSVLKCGDTVYSKAVASGKCDEQLRRGAHGDIKAINGLCAIKCSELKQFICEITGGKYGDIVYDLPEWDCSGGMDAMELENFIELNGTGIFAANRAFLWSDAGFTPILTPDTICPDDMIGYEWQRETVYKNTKSLTEKKNVNNILLYGDSGTGKSATVKSMLNVPEFRSLRIIEVAKHCLMQLPELMRELAGRRQQFILFIDDLSFEDGDKNYSALKVILEGGLEQRPVNVAIYATSNRRQLVKRRFSERDDEIEKGESAQEKTSLADRFGIRIPYLSLDRKQYLDMAENLSRRAGCDMNSEDIRREALKWEMEHAGRTPRVACQFAEFIAQSGQQSV